jgi:hypothetical protein
MKMTDIDWNSESLPQEHQSPEKFEMDAEFYPKRVAELEQQLAGEKSRTALLDVLMNRQKEIYMQQLAECQKFDAWKANPYTKVLEDSLVECQAQVKAAKREALLEIADTFEILGGASTSQLRNWAKELE